MPHFWIMRSFFACASMGSVTAAHPGSRNSAFSDQRHLLGVVVRRREMEVELGRRGPRTTSRTAGVHTSRHATK
jgi:hypothetical protein